MPEVPAHQKVLVAASFLDDPSHGRAGCDTCHGGNPAGLTRREAYLGLAPDPSAANAATTCGSAACHPQAVADNTQSFHTTVKGIRDSLVRRGGLEPLSAELHAGFGNHCSSCHSTCGNCHVSVPAPAGGGLLEGHKFKKSPNTNLVCTACHGSRVGDEFKGLNHFPDGGVLVADVHYRRGMQCIACHTQAEMHGVGQQGLTNRYQVANAPKCENCHPDDAQFKAQFAHGIANHREPVSGQLALACQVCHSVAYKNCYSCHVELKNGKPAYVVNEANNFESRLDFKIGLNPNRDALHPQKWVTLRHTTGDPDNFQFYGSNLMPAFNAGGPTWRLATPHNIQRSTPQAAQCTASCHGRRGLFLDTSDLFPYELGANAPVVVSDTEMP